MNTTGFTVDGKGRNVIILSGFSLDSTLLYGTQRNKGKSLVMICALISMIQFTVARNPTNAARWTDL